MRDPAGDDFQVGARMLAETVEHHAGEEEQEMFPQSHALGETALEALGQRMAEHQQHLKSSAVTKAPITNQTRDSAPTLRLQHQASGPDTSGGPRRWTGRLAHVAVGRLPSVFTAGAAAVPGSNTSVLANGGR